MAQQFDDTAFRMSGVDVVRKWVDAKVFYDSDQLDRTVLVLASLVQSPAFQRSRNYHEALFMYGQSLFRLGASESSLPIFDLLLQNRPSQTHVHNALFYAIEAALKLGRENDVARYLDTMRASRVSSPELLYVAGKAYYFRGDFNQSIRLLGQIPANAAVYPQSRYYLGVARTALGQLDTAQTAFKDVSFTSGDKQEGQEIRDLANMALGRLEIERGKWDQAVDYYQKVPRGSIHFPRSVYELAWAYVNSGKLQEAIRAFDVIILVAKDEELVLTASMDRGQLLIHLDQHQDAQEAFEEVHRRFVPIRDELERFTQSDKNLELYFRWLIHRYDKRYTLDLPLSERAAQWVRAGAGLEELVKTLDDIAIQGREIAQLDQIVKDLNTALTGSDRVGLFPSLNNAWVQLVATENALIQQKKDLLEVEYRAQRKKLPREERLRMDALRKQAKELESQSGTDATEAGAYRQRLQDMSERFKKLRREAFQISRSLKSLNLEIASIDRYIKEAEAEPDPNEKPVDKSLMTDLKAEKKRLVDLSRQLETIRQDIRAEIGQLGLGGAAQRTEDSDKVKLLAIYEELKKLSGSHGSVARITRLHQKIELGFDQVTKIKEAIDKHLAMESEKLLRVVSEEAVRIENYREHLGLITDRGESLARVVGTNLFQRAKTRIRKTVLRADLGIVDLAWERKQKLTDEIASLNIQRAEKITSVKSILDEMLATPGYQPISAMDAKTDKKEEEKKKAPAPKKEPESDKPSDDKPTASAPPQG
ncbi:MAG: hypothetical protein CMH54_04730 [Myxococcales bacterium]|nr:hypothetical protein [Myxococcales bacterium]